MIEYCMGILNRQLRELLVNTLRHDFHTELTNTMPKFRFQSARYIPFSILTAHRDPALKDPYTTGKDPLRRDRDVS